MIKTIHKNRIKKSNSKLKKFYIFKLQKKRRNIKSIFAQQKEVIYLKNGRKFQNIN